MKNIHPINLKFTTPQIFLDLDGVFADFNKKFKQISGHNPDWYIKTFGSKQFWITIYKHHNFFIELDLIDGSEKLWDYCKDKNPIFLTGAPNSDIAKLHKIEWVKQKFGSRYKTIILPKKEKCLYANLNGFRNILIDDTLININQWNISNGIGIHHTGNFDSTLEALKEIYES